jgi:hypothetical protein
MPEAISGVRAGIRYLVAASLATLLTGCVSLEPVASTPSSGLSTVGATLEPPSVSAAPPSASISASPPVPAQSTEPPTEAPTLFSSGAPPTPPASSGSIEDFGADELLFNDDFSDPTSGWGVGPNAAGDTAYVDGALQMDTVDEGYWMWSSRTHPLAWTLMHVEASFTPSANGYVGLFCTRGVRDLWGGRIRADGTWSFARVDDEGAHDLTSDQEPGWEIAPGATTRVALDCAGTETGPLRLQLSLPDAGLAASYEGSEGEGDARFDSVAVYTRSSANPYSVRIDDVVAYGGE